MTLTIELTPQEDAWLREQSTIQGLQPAEIVKRMVDEHLPLRCADPLEAVSPAIRAENAATIALLDAWLQEDATDDPDELKKAEEDLRDFKRNMNAPRKENGERLLFPEVE